MEEVWRPIKGWERYEVSSEGRVRSKKMHVRLGNHTWEKPGRILKQAKNQLGYCFVALCDKPNLKYVLVHILVADAFPEICGDRFPGSEVNHKNEIKEDNRACNLEICDHQYNCEYSAYKRVKEKKQKAKRKVAQYDMNGNLIKIWEKGTEAAKIYGGTIYDCLRKKTKKSKGYYWEYVRLF